MELVPDCELPKPRIRPPVVVVVRIQTSVVYVVGPAVAAAFETWTRALTRGLVRGGVTPERASELSEVIVAMMEGATLLARARRDPAPVRAAARTMQLAVRDGASPTVGPA